MNRRPMQVCMCGETAAVPKAEPRRFVVTGERQPQSTGAGEPLPKLCHMLGPVIQRIDREPRVQKGRDATTSAGSEDQDGTRGIG